MKRRGAYACRSVPELPTEIPGVCPQCGNYLKLKDGIVRCVCHPEGAQCFNCFKIIYLDMRRA